MKYIDVVLVFLVFLHPNRLQKKNNG